MMDTYIHTYITQAPKLLNFCYFNLLCVFFCIKMQLYLHDGREIKTDPPPTSTTSSVLLLRCVAPFIPPSTSTNSHLLISSISGAAPLMQPDCVMWLYTPDAHTAATLELENLLTKKKNLPLMNRSPRPTISLPSHDIGTM